jgi:rubrerythrin
MRKDADFAVNDKVSLNFNTSSDEFSEVLESFQDFLMKEALLSEVKKSKDPDGDIVASFDYEEENITFSLRK